MVTGISGYTNINDTPVSMLLVSMVTGINGSVSILMITPVSMLLVSMGTPVSMVTSVSMLLVSMVTSVSMVYWYQWLLVSMVTSVSMVIGINGYISINGLVLMLH